MGAYLDTPVKQKTSEDGDEGAPRMQYAVSEMQGWRKNMEDAHVTLPELTPESHPVGKVSLFAVFDGHGGREVAAFCAKHMPEELVKLESFREGKFEQALVEVFHHMDVMLRQPEAAAELAALRDGRPPLAGAGASAAGASSAGASSASSTTAEAEDGAGGGAMDGAVVAADGVGAEEAAVAAPRSVKESMQAEVQEQMAQAEAKGSLSKTEALELVMKMMRLKRMEDQASGSAGTDGTSSSPQPSYTDAGCTAIACLLHGKELYVANAGDSRAVMCSSGGAVALSHDHKPTHATELARIERAGGHVNEAGRVNGNLNLSRSIGDLRYKTNSELGPAEQVITAQPDVHVFELSEADEYIVIACDGVFDVMSNEALVSFVNKQLSAGPERLSQVLELVFEECICESPAEAQGIGADNMTAEMILLKPLSYFATAAPCPE